MPLNGCATIWAAICPPHWSPPIAARPCAAWPRIAASPSSPSRSNPPPCAPRSAGWPIRAAGARKGPGKNRERRIRPHPGPVAGEVVAAGGSVGLSDRLAHDRQVVELAHDVPALVGAVHQAEQVRI